jgi:hypothetical protein
VSWARRCAEAGFPDVNTNVSLTLDFIHNHTYGTCTLDSGSSMGDRMSNIPFEDVHKLLTVVLLLLKLVA